MKYMILILLLMSSPMHGQIRYNFFDHTYYTFPEDPKVDPQLYHEYMCILNIYMLELVNAQVPVDIRDDCMEMFLLDINNHTAKRLLDDLREANRASSLIELNSEPVQFKSAEA